MEPSYPLCHVEVLVHAGKILEIRSVSAAQVVIGSQLADVRIRIP